MSKNTTKELLIKNKQQLIRFGIVGSVNTAIDFGLLFLFKSLGIPVAIANIISTGIAFIVSFFANKKYTFKSTDTNIVREMVLFVIVTLLGLWVLQTLVIQWLLPYATDITHDKNIALLICKLIATGISMIWNYILYDKLVFKKTTS